MRIDYLLAWLLPAFVGGGFCWLASARQRRGGEIAASLGMGWVGGLFVAAFALSWLGRADTTHALALTWPWLVALGVLGWAAGIARSLSARASPGNASPDRGVWSRVLWWLLLVLILVRLLLLAEEAALRPLFPWDAWSAWAVKPKTWMLLGHFEPYVSMTKWLANPVAPTRSVATWNYPELLAWLQVWFASGAGGWNEPLVGLAWCGALAAFALAAYGYWRGFGLRPWLAITLVYLLVSLPLIDAHVALAGYADLWVAVILGLATLAWSRWMLFRERGHGLLAVAFALCLPAIKLEGAIWLLAFSAVFALDLLPSHWRRIIAAAAAAMIIVGLLFGGFVLPMLGLGWVHVAWESVTIPMIGKFELAWHPVGGAMLASLFTLPNWHLLWYVLPLLVALRWRALVRDHVARMLCLFVLLQLAFLFVLFYFTDAAAWANDFTSANRLILQIVPCVFVFAAVLLREAGASRTFSSLAPGRSRGRLLPISPA
ncbi:MAG: hypothetical protein ABI843_11160 [Dokdonella sp.]